MVFSALYVNSALDLIGTWILGEFSFFFSFAFSRNKNIIYHCGLIWVVLQISTNSYQDTAEKPNYPDPVAPDMFEYLTGNSTTQDTDGIISNVL